MKRREAKSSQLQANLSKGNLRKGQATAASAAGSAVKGSVSRYHKQSYSTGASPIKQSGLKQKDGRNLESVTESARAKLAELGRHVPERKQRPQGAAEPSMKGKLDFSSVISSKQDDEQEKASSSVLGEETKEIRQEEQTSEINRGIQTPTRARGNNEDEVIREPECATPHERAYNIKQAEKTILSPQLQPQESPSKPAPERRSPATGPQGIQGGMVSRNSNAKAKPTAAQDKTPADSRMKNGLIDSNKLKSPANSTKLRTATKQQRSKRTIDYGTKHASDFKQAMTPYKAPSYGQKYPDWARNKAPSQSASKFDNPELRSISNLPSQSRSDANSRFQKHEQDPSKAQGAENQTSLAASKDPESSARAVPEQKTMMQSYSANYISLKNRIDKSQIGISSQQRRMVSNQSAVFQTQGKGGALSTLPGSPGAQPTMARQSSERRISNSQIVSDRLFKNTTSQLALMRRQSRLSQLSVDQEGVEKEVGDQNAGAGGPISARKGKGLLSKYSMSQISNNYTSQRRILGQNVTVKSLSKSRPVQSKLGSRLQQNTSLTGGKTSNFYASASKQRTNSSGMPGSQQFAAQIRQQTAQKQPRKFQVDLASESGESSKGEARALGSGGPIKEQEDAGKTSSPATLRQSPDVRTQKAARKSIIGEQVQQHQNAKMKQANEQIKSKLAGVESKTGISKAKYDQYDYSSYEALLNQAQQEQARTSVSPDRKKARDSSNIVENFARSSIVGSPDRRRSSINPFLEAVDGPSPARSQKLGNRIQTNLGVKKNARTSIIALQEASNINDEELLAYKKFAGEFEKVILYNQFKEDKLSKENFIKIIIDLGIIYKEKLSIQYLTEFAMSLPMITLLWSILTKNQDIPVRMVTKNDLFTILAAILDLQVSDMLSEDEQVFPTKNPLFYRNKQGEVVFLSYDDLRKFGLRFEHLQGNFHKHEQRRADNIERLKAAFVEQQSQGLAAQLERELTQMTGGLGLSPQLIAKFKRSSTLRVTTALEKSETAAASPLKPVDRKTEVKPAEATSALISQLAQKRISKIVEKTEQDYDPNADWQNDVYQQKQRKSMMRQSVAFQTQGCISQEASPLKTALDNKRRSFVNMYIQGISAPDEEQSQSSPAKSHRSTTLGGAGGSGSQRKTWAARMSTVVDAAKRASMANSPLKIPKELPRVGAFASQDRKAKLKEEDEPDEASETTRPIGQASQSEKMAKEVLGGVYGQSLGQYAQEALKLEKEGSTDHLKANLQFRATLTKTSDMREEQLEQYEEQVTTTIKQVNGAALRSGRLDRERVRQLKRDLSSGFLEEQDRKILEDYSTAQTDNSVGQRQVPGKKIQRELEKMAQERSNEQKEKKLTTKSTLYPSASASKIQSSQGQGQSKVQTKREIKGAADWPHLRSTLRKSNIMDSRYGAPGSANSKVTPSSKFQQKLKPVSAQAQGVAGYGKTSPSKGAGGTGSGQDLSHHTGYQPRQKIFKSKQEIFRETQQTGELTAQREKPTAGQAAETRIRYGNAKGPTFVPKKQNPFLALLDPSSAAAGSPDLPVRPSSKQRIEEKYHLNHAHDADCTACEANQAQTAKTTPYKGARAKKARRSRDQRDNKIKTKVTKSEAHNIKVKQKNQGFSQRVKRRAQAADFESSDDTDELTAREHTPLGVNEGGGEAEQGQLIVLNVDLGVRGMRVLQGLSNQRAEDIAGAFCQKHKLGAGMRAKVLRLVEGKLRQFQQYKGHQYKREYRSSKPKKSSLIAQERNVRSLFRSGK